MPILLGVVIFVGLALIVFAFYLGSVGIQIEDPVIVSKPPKVVQEGDKPAENILELPVNSKFTSKSYLLYDVNSDEIVGGKDIDKQVANASTTKLMTALVAIENYPLNKKLTVPADCIGLEGNNVGFTAGEEFYVEDILYGVLLRSASDAVCTLTSNYSGDFILQMNKRAKDLKLMNTNYINAIGLDAPNHYSSSKDLLTLLLEIKKVDTLKIMMGSRDFTLRDLAFNKTYYVQNTNQLLFEVPGAVGYKTGFTSGAGECLVFGYNNFGTETIIVVMGSADRFYDAKHLLDLYLMKINTPENSKPTLTPIPSNEPLNDDPTPTNTKIIQ